MSSRETCFAALLCVATLSATATSALAQSVKVSVRTQAGATIDAKVYRKTGAVVDMQRTGGDGEAVFAPVSCSPDVQFRIEPITPFAEYDREWQSCRTMIAMQVRPFVFGKGLDAILAPDGSLAQPTSLASYSQVPGVYAALVGPDPLADAVRVEAARLAAAADAGHWGTFAVSANNLAAIYRVTGKGDVAARYSAAAIEMGARLASQSPFPDSRDFIAEQSDGRLVESAAAREVLRDFQRREGLATDSWDYRTFATIRAKESSRPDQEEAPLSANEP